MANAVSHTNPGELKLGRLFRYLMITIAGTYTLAAIFYADPFHFWEHALSELGTTVTLHGTPNLESSLIVTIGMFVSGRLMLEIARLYQQNPTQPHAKIKRYLMLTASLGAFISIFPNNLFHTIHSYGSAFIIGSIFFIDILLMQDILASQKPAIFYFLIGILSLSVISYAASYFLELPIKQATQKICVINLLLILVQSTPQPSHQISPFATHHST